MNRCGARCPLSGHHGQRCFREAGHAGEHENIAVWWSDDGESGPKGQFDPERYVARWSPPTTGTRDSSYSGRVHVPNSFFQADEEIAALFNGEE